VFEFSKEMINWLYPLTGNNLFGENLKRKLLELKAGSADDSFAAYILMQRIFPPVHRAYMLRNGKLNVQGAVSELGIFATYVRCVLT
jgi:glutathione synthase